MTTCRYCRGAGGKNVVREETCSKCNGFGRGPHLGKDIYCSRCFGSGTISATIWESCSCNQGAGCFPAGTLVMTPSGQAEISSLGKGDMVLSFDWKNQAFLPRKILKVLTYSGRRSLLLTLANGNCIRVTPNHNILANGQWVRAAFIKRGTTVSTFAKAQAVAMLENMRVINVDDGGNSVLVYNPVVEESFSLIANGVITHNFNRCKQLKMLYWNLYGCLMCAWNPGVLRSAMQTASVEPTVTYLQPKHCINPDLSANCDRA